MTPLNSTQTTDKSGSGCSRSCTTGSGITSAQGCGRSYTCKLTSTESATTLTACPYSSWSLPDLANQLPCRIHQLGQWLTHQMVPSSLVINRLLPRMVLPPECRIGTAENAPHVSVVCGGPSSSGRRPPSCTWPKGTEQLSLSTRWRPCRKQTRSPCRGICRKRISWRRWGNICSLGCIDTAGLRRRRRQPSCTGTWRSPDQPETSSGGSWAISMGCASGRPPASWKQNGGGIKRKALAGLFPLLPGQICSAPDGGSGLQMRRLSYH